MTGPVLGVRVDPVARSFVLDQNFPNPFNPVTVIRYAIPSAGRVRLAVHDLLGREVAVLLDGEQEPGRIPLPSTERGWPPASTSTGCRPAAAS